MSSKSHHFGRPHPFTWLPIWEKWSHSSLHVVKFRVMHMASIPEGWQWVRFCHSSWAFVFVLSSGTGIRSDISDTVYLPSAVTFWIGKVTPLIFSLFLVSGKACDHFYQHHLCLYEHFPPEPRIAGSSQFFLHSFGREPFGISGTGFLWVDDLPSNQPTVSKHWRKL